jgi:iron complex transport system ATP-binding protein
LVSVRLDGVRAGYGGREVLRGIDLALAAGTVTALLGPNGSGKSTLLKAIAGLVPHAGSIVFGDSAAGARIGFLPQDASGRAQLSVLETVLLGRIASLGLRVPPGELAAAAATVEGLGLAALAERTLGELSGGQRQMVFLAQALAGEPKVLLLDEPTGALDLKNQLEMLAAIVRLTRARGLATAIAIHDLNAAARFADRLALLKDGLFIAAGAAADVLRADSIADAYGIAAFVQAGPDGRPTVTPYRTARPPAAPRGSRRPLNA